MVVVVDDEYRADRKSWYLMRVKIDIRKDGD